MYKSLWSALQPGAHIAAIQDHAAYGWVFCTLNLNIISVNISQRHTFDYRYKTLLFKLLNIQPSPEQKHIFCQNKNISTLPSILTTKPDIHMPFTLMLHIDTNGCAEEKAQIILQQIPSPKY